MANHGYVKTKRTIKPDEIQTILEELNAGTFKNALVIVRSGDHWDISCPRKAGGDYGYRTCWLATKRTFEMRHGGGANFIWWVDTVILDTIARKFDGTISDDGVEERWKSPERNCTLAEYMQRMYRSGIPLDELEFVPPEFHDGLKDLNWVSITLRADGVVEITPVKPTS